MDTGDNTTADVDNTTSNPGTVSLDDDFELTIESPRSPAHEDDIQLDLGTLQGPEEPNPSDLDHQGVPNLVKAWGEGGPEIVIREAENKESGGEHDVETQDDAERNVKQDSEVIDESNNCIGSGDAQEKDEESTEYRDEFTYQSDITIATDSAVQSATDSTVQSATDSTVQSVKIGTTGTVDEELNADVTISNKCDEVIEQDNMKITDVVQDGEKYLKQSKEFSDVLTETVDKTGDIEDGFMSIPNADLMTADASNDDTNDEFTAVPAVDLTQSRDRGEVERETQDSEDEDEEAVSLDRILMKEKEETESDDDEFDFDLPVTKPSVPVVNLSESTTKPAESLTTQTTASTPATMATEVEHKKPDQGVLSSAQNQSSPRGQQQQMTHDVRQAVPPSVPKATIYPIETPSQVAPHIVEGHHRPSKLEAAQNEWDNVRTIQAGYKEAGTDRGMEPTVVETIPPVSPHELKQVFECEDFSTVKSNIRPTLERRGFSAFVSFLFGPPKLNRPLLDHRDRVFCMAATPFSNEKTWHIRTLQTIYRSLTGSKFDSPRIGSHWEEIGFQGTDPATDLRGVGILGLTTLLFFLKDPQRHSLASDIYRLSLHPTQNFPFCLMSINLSRIALQIMREELLNRECNRRGDVLVVFNDFMVALYLQMYQVWKGQGKTISDAGFIIKDIETKARKNPRAIIKHLEDYLDKKSQVSVNIRTEKRRDSEEGTFTNVCDDK